MSAGKWCYLQSEPHLWTVGFYGPDGEWESESDHDSAVRASQRVSFLNGGGPAIFAGKRDKTIRELQTSLPWTVHYHRDFRSSAMAHKDFGHALLHITKAAGKLAAVVNDAEHGGSEFTAAEVDNYVADLVVCALRMANTCPGRIIDLQAVVEARIINKNAQAIEGVKQ